MCNYIYTHLFYGYWGCPGRQKCQCLCSFPILIEGSRKDRRLSRILAGSQEMGREVLLLGGPHCCLGFDL